MNLIQSLLSRKRRNSLIASETDVGKDLEQAETQPEISLIASDTDVGKELEQAVTQPEKRQRTMDEQSMVVCNQQQRSCSTSQLTSQLVTLYINKYPSIVILKEKLDRLSARRKDFITELEHAEIQAGNKRRKEVSHWLNKVEEKIDKLRSMINGGQGSSSSTNISDSIESFITEIDDLIERGTFPKGLTLLDHRSTRCQLLLEKKPVGIKFQQNNGKILEWLREHEHFIIGVYGMGGVGKTTLLKHIHDQLLQDPDLFGDVYWVTVSQNCSVRELQEDIARAVLGSDLHEHDETKRAGLLHSKLASRGPIVLILDDMWDHISESKVGIPLEKTNFKIILSSRSYDVCRKMGCKDFVVMAEILHEKEAWDLFVEKLGHYDTLKEEAKEIAWDVAKECGGLPLAITTMARSMTGVVNFYEWRNALNELKSARGQGDLEKDVLQILRYSYDRLKDKRLQTCFLSCILYGEDVEIRETTLIDLWIDEGLLDEIESRDDQVVKGRDIIRKLESCCLFESATNGINVHDLIRDMAIIITKKHPLFIAEAGKQLKQVPKEEKWSKDLAKVSLTQNKFVEIPSGMAPMTPNLTVLMLNESPLKEIPDLFFVHMRALRVLDLSHTKIERVPESVSNLENLRVLLLNNCGDLIYVPSIAKLSKLRRLDLDRCYNFKEAPRQLERLKCIEELSYMPWDVSNMIGFNKVIKSLTSLSRYRFWIADFTLCKAVDEWDAFSENEKVVWITGLKYEDNSSVLLPTTLERLIIDKSVMQGRCLGDVFQSLGETTSLKYVKIRDCRGLESIAGSSRTHSLLCTSQLKTLEVEWLPDLRSIAKLGVPYFFTHLQHLFIIGCSKLKVVFPITCSNELHLPNLKTIAVRGCEEVEEIFESNKSILSKPLLLLPKLESLELCYLSKIKVIFSFTEELHLPNLEIIKVSLCREVEKIFETNKANPSKPNLSLPKLKYLNFRGLPKLGSIYSGLLLCPSLSSMIGCPEPQSICCRDSRYM